MLLYVHVPFCRRKCPYCAFYSEVASAEKLEAYVRRLLLEIAHWGDTLGKVPVQTLFFGGGTPSLLPLNALSAIVSALDRAFTLEPGFEFSLEGNPNSLAGMDYLNGLRQIGVNRLSIGVQSLDDQSLKVLGRIHDARLARLAFDQARTLGFTNINIDLIRGVPGKRLKLWLDELKEAVRWQPEHISCYDLTVEGGTPFAEQCLNKEITLESEEELSKMFVYGSEYLESQGYLHYEISNFARMGYVCRHNLGYWEGSDYLGLGPSAVSTLHGERWENPSDLARYFEAVDKRTLGADKEPLAIDVRVRELVMLRLRTARGLDFKEYKRLTGKDFPRQHEQLVTALHKNGLVRIRDGYIRLTKTGMLVADTVVENVFHGLENQSEESTR